MYADEACTKAIKTTSTDQQGIAHFEGIKFGTTIYIKETKAPSGYETSKELIKVTIDEAWVLGNKTKTIQFANEVIPQTPNTGDTIDRTFYLTLIILTGYCMYRLLSASKYKI